MILSCGAVANKVRVVAPTSQEHIPVFLDVHLVGTAIVHDDIYAASGFGVQSNIFLGTEAVPDA